MNIVIIYKSSYGFTQTYAQWLAHDLQADLFSAKNINSTILQQYQTIIYGGGLYAGGVNGLSLLTKNFPLLKDKNLYLFTVGAADVTDLENITNIRNNLKQKLSSEMWEKFHIYHFRGGMRYSKMSFIHRNLMKAVVSMLRKKPEDTLRRDDKDMLATYGQDVDFTDHTSLSQLIADVKAIEMQK